MRPTKDLVDRMCAGQKPATGAPPGTRTPNPRIKSPNPVISFGFGLCQLVSFPQVSNESPGRRVPSSAAPVHGHRALMEHRDRLSVLHRRTRWGSGGAVKAADFGSARSVATVTWSVAPVRSDRVRAEERSHTGRVVQPAGGVEKTNAIESRGDVQAPPSAVVDPPPPLCRLRVGAFRRAAGECPAVRCQAVTGVRRRRAPVEGTRNGRRSFAHMPMCGHGSRRPRRWLPRGGRTARGRHRGGGGRAGPRRGIGLYGMSPHCSTCATDPTQLVARLRQPVRDRDRRRSPSASADLLRARSVPAGRRLCALGWARKVSVAIPTHPREAPSATTAAGKGGVGLR